MAAKLTKEQWVEKAKNVHGDLYDYSKVEYVNSSTKVTIGCKIHGGFEQSPNQHSSGQGCPKCGGTAKLTKEEWVAKAVAVHGNKYDYSKSDYKTNKGKVTITCPVHGDFEILAGNHTSQKQGCRKCGVEKAADSRRMSQEEFIKRSTEVHGGVYDYSKVIYTATSDYVTIVCSVHGDFKQIAGHHLNGHGCSTCAWTRPSTCKLTTEEWVKKATEKHKGKYDYSKSVYTGNEKKITITCPIHGDFEQLANDHVSKGAGCRKCTKSNPHTRESFIERARSIHGDKYSYDKVDYVNVASKITITCPKHGDFVQTANDHTSCRAGCPSCSCNGISSGENELNAFVKSLGFATETRNRSIIKPYELDIVIPEKKFAIEYNGLYYHSTAFDNRPNRHKIKLDMASAAGYKLIHVYDDWRDKRGVVEKTLKHLLGVTERKVFARECEVSVVDGKDFLTTNHIQGHGNGVCYGLSLKCELLAVMQFSQAVSERGNTDSTRFELVRFATKCSVVGGASRLFKAFLQNNQNVRSVISYSDNDLFDGGMYRQLGFEFSGHSRPDYKIIVNGRRYHKANFKKKLLAKKYPEAYDQNLTEFEICQKLKFYRIYNSGLRKWVYNVT